jgi:hypothetical protein
MTGRNRIWEELKQAKANIICLQRYTGRSRKRLRCVNALIITCATLGSMGGMYSKWIAIAGAGLVATGSVLKTLLPNITQSEQELSELDRFYKTCVLFEAAYDNGLNQKARKTGGYIRTKMGWIEDGRIYYRQQCEYLKWLQIVCVLLIFSYLNVFPIH